MERASRRCGRSASSPRTNSRACFGFKDRQTVSAIETGERRVSAEELLLAVQKLGASLDYFTDPFELAGEGRFSWRREPRVGPEQIKALKCIAGGWIAASRAFAGQVGRPTPILRHALKLTPKSTYEEAMAAGERFAKDFELAPFRPRSCRRQWSRSSAFWC